MGFEKPYYITTPIYYVNDVPHIGHAYTTLACDVIARFMRLQGKKVKFLTGTDEHGKKVEKSASDKGIEPQKFVDKVSQNFRTLAEKMAFSYDDFIRTTEPRHKKAVEALWQKLVEKGQIYKGSYAGWYAVRDEAYYAESELVNGKAPTGAEVEWIEEESYFFKLSEWGEVLLKYFEDYPDFIAPESRRNEIISFVKGGLRDLSISRTGITWGIPVPKDPKHVIYVWLDALTNYIAAVEYPETETGSFKEFWPADLHMVGKDILRFHGVYWPAFLMAAGLPVPKRVFAHGWWTNEGEKISKSLGNVIDPLMLIEQYGLDPVRYFLLREVPFGKDGDFSKKALIQRLNSDLANDLGNLGQRTLSFIAKNCGGILPIPQAFTPEDEGLLALVKVTLTELQDLIVEKQALQRALELIWQVISAANRYIDSEQPWALRKTNPDRMGTVLYVLCETLRHIGFFIQPFMPESASHLLTQLGVEENQRDFAFLKDPLKGGTLLPAPRALFPRYVEEKDAC